MYTVVSNHSDR